MLGYKPGMLSYLFNLFSAHFPASTIPADTPKAMEKAVVRYREDLKITLMMVFNTNNAKNHTKNLRNICPK